MKLYDLLYNMIFYGMKLWAQLPIVMGSGFQYKRVFMKMKKNYISGTKQNYIKYSTAFETARLYNIYETSNDIMFIKVISESP